MKFSRLFLFLAASLCFISSATWATLTPGARYFSGQVNVSLSQPTPCYVEAVFSAGNSAISVRSIGTLPHLSATGETHWVALGPYTAQFLAPRALYRFQDPTPGALVKDLVLNVDGAHTPVKHAVLFWHAQAGHHDPIVCDRLTEALSEADLAAIKDVFGNFDGLKP